MAPILIDKRGLIKLGLISAFTTLAVFVVGFLSGYQQASTFYLAESETEILSLPVQSALQESEVAPHSPVAIVAGEDIDVDQPKPELKKMDADSELISAEPNTIVADDKMASIKDKAMTKNQQSLNVLVVDETPLSKKSLIVDVASLSPAELADFKYSIQVGMYGRLINAENMVKMLQAQQFDAYVSDYTNSKNESRYNVRFGYFVNKKSARVALKRYKNTQNSDGYLVNFSVKNLVKLAGVKGTEQSVGSEKILKKTSDKKLPAEVKSTEVGIESAVENISQLDDSHAKAILAVAQTKALTDVPNNTITK